MNERELLIKEIFGKNDKYNGYQNICDILITNGECITTVYAKDIFTFGGICNFIHAYNYDSGVDLIRLVFDKEDFLNSKMFDEYRISTIEDLECELKNAQDKVFKIQSKIENLK